MIISELIEHLQQFDPDDPVAASIWLLPDVKARAEDLGVTLDEDEMAFVLHDIHENHDANYGIAWHTLDFYISPYASEDAA
jgi:hypothetical protein